MAERSLPSNWKNCATCSRWCGRQIPDAFNANVKFDPNEKAKCAGGGFNGAQMGPMSSCGKWEQRFKR